MTNYLSQKQDIDFLDRLRDEADQIRKRGESVAIVKRDWHLGRYSYLNCPYILILDAEKNLLAIADESDLLDIFGHQIWLSFLRRVQISEFVGFDQRPPLEGIQPTGRLGVPPWPVFGGQIKDILNWVP